MDICSLLQLAWLFLNLYQFTFFGEIQLKFTLPIAIMVVFDLWNTYSTIIGVLVTFYPIIMNLREARADSKAIGTSGEFASKLKLIA